MCGAYANFKVQPDTKNFFRPRLNFFNPPASCNPETGNSSTVTPVVSNLRSHPALVDGYLPYLPPTSSFLRSSYLLDSSTNISTCLSTPVSSYTKRCIGHIHGSGAAHTLLRKCTSMMVVACVGNILSTLRSDGIQLILLESRSSCIYELQCFILRFFFFYPIQRSLIVSTRCSAD